MAALAARGDYIRPGGLEEALAHLARARYTLLAGGTDFYPARQADVITEPVLDVSGIAALRAIAPIADGWRIGALATWRDIQKSALPSPYRALTEAARTIGGVQIQNVATIGGNVCNASPAADGVVALLALEARVVLASVEAQREVALADFLTGARQTVRRDDEMVIALDVPARSPRAQSTFLKLGQRRYLVISMAMVSVLIDRDDAGRINFAAVAVGACSARALRLARLEARLIGAAGEAGAPVLIEDADLAELTPIDDIRGPAAYRRAAVKTLLGRALSELAR